MSLTSTAGGGATSPALGVSFEGRPRALLEAVAPLVDVVEVVPDCLVGPDGRVNPRLLDDLDELAGDTDLTYHGIGLSLGSSSGWNEDYLRLLDTFLDWRTPRWHSEHLGFCLVDGSFLGTMPALPATHEALELVVDRATGCAVATGWSSCSSTWPARWSGPSEMSLASFLNTIAEETGSRLLLDLHNLECDVDNGQLDLDAFVDELDWSHVGEIHLAGGSGTRAITSTSTPDWSHRRPAGCWTSPWSARTAWSWCCSRCWPRRCRCSVSRPSPASCATSAPSSTRCRFSPEVSPLAVPRHDGRPVDTLAAYEQLIVSQLGAAPPAALGGSDVTRWAVQRWATSTIRDLCPLTSTLLDLRGRLGDGGRGTPAGRCAPLRRTPGRGPSSPGRVVRRPAARRRRRPGAGDHRTGGHLAAPARPVGVARGPAGRRRGAGQASTRAAAATARAGATPARRRSRDAAA